VVKEMKFRPKIDEHDYVTKMKHVERFLAGGPKVKRTIMFRGREVFHPELGLRILERVAEQVSEIAIVESAPRQDGRNMTMVLHPIKRPAKARAAAAPPPATGNGSEGEQGCRRGRQNAGRPSGTSPRRHRPRRRRRRPGTAAKESSDAEDEDTPGGGQAVPGHRVGQHPAPEGVSLAPAREEVEPPDPPSRSWSGGHRRRPQARRTSAGPVNRTR